MPGLLRGIARTAVVAGTATAVSNRVSRRQAGRWAEQDQQQYEHEQYEQQRYQPPPAPPVVPAAPTKDTGDMVEQLKELAGLKDAGILTEDEFLAQKARILAS